MTAYDAQLAGASSKSDVIVIGPSSMTAVVGSPATAAIGATPRVAGWLLDAATTEIVAGQIWIPPAWGSLTADFYWTNAGAGSGNVAWRFDLSGLPDGSTLPDPASGTLVVSAAPAQNTLKRSFLAPTPLAAPDGLAAFECIRVATDAADTLANDAALVAVVLTRVS